MKQKYNYNDRVIVVRGTHKSRFAVRVYSQETYFLYVEKKSGCGVRVAKNCVRKASR